MAVRHISLTSPRLDMRRLASVEVIFKQKLRKILRKQNKNKAKSWCAKLRLIFSFKFLLQSGKTPKNIGEIEPCPGKPVPRLVKTVLRLVKTIPRLVLSGIRLVFSIILIRITENTLPWTNRKLMYGQSPCPTLLVGTEDVYRTGV